MVEAGAKQIAEDVLLDALELAHETIKQASAPRRSSCRRKAGKPKWYDAGRQAGARVALRRALRRGHRRDGLAGISDAATEILADELPAGRADAGEEVMVRRTQVRTGLRFLADARRAAAVKAPVQEQFGDAIRSLSDAEQDSKELKSAKRQALVERIVADVQLPFPAGPGGVIDAATAGAVKASIDSIYKQIVRTKIAVDKRRPDGRSENEIRQVTAQVGLTPRTHGSALFTRGQTQALTLLTLGTVKEEQRLDDLSLETTKRYIHHYNFPPFSVGETGFMRGPKRRDIGHGALAERALVPVVPKSEQFAYTIRAVSEILESNGSSSMASVCGSSLALIDAGVPISAPVAGIAMGLIKEGDEPRHPDRHPGRRGPSRRHGLQGRRHGRGHHRAADGHQDHGRDRARSCATALAQARTPGCRILAGHERDDLRAPHRDRGARPAGAADADLARPDRPAHRQGRRDDPRPRRRSTTVQIDVEEDG